MSKGQPRRRCGSSVRHRSLWRVLWGLLLLLHAPATIKVFSVAFGYEAGESGWSSLLVISATNLVFLFEIVFASSLRLLNNRRALIAFLMVIALLHVGVIDRVCPDLALGENLHLWLALTTGGAVTWYCLLPLLIPLFGELRNPGGRLRRQLAYRRYAQVYVPILHASHPRLMSRTLPDRAPPAQSA